jgi:NAD(P)H-quinone oxidoreductase subunit H
MPILSVKFKLRGINAKHCHSFSIFGKGEIFKIPKGEIYTRVESGKGELGIYLIGDDHAFPWRWKIRPADFNNLQVLPEILRGVKVADLVVVLGSIDIIMGSVDR